MKAPSSVLLLSSSYDTRLATDLQYVKSWLEKRGLTVHAWREDEPVPEDVDLVLVLGGDGTFLRAVRALEHTAIPFLGIRYGTFGYLAELEPDSWEPEFERLLQGEGRVEFLQRLSYQVGGRSTSGGLAVNDVVVTACEPARLVELLVLIDGEEITRFRGDGMILATPVGSTGHSLAAGGPIVEASDRCMLMTPLASQALTFRPLVLREDHRVELVVQGARVGAALTVDGQSYGRLDEGARVEVTGAPRDLPLATVVRRSRFRTLRERLHWADPLIGPSDAPSTQV